jgi:hypothetical protein
MTDNMLKYKDFYRIIKISPNVALRQRENAKGQYKNSEWRVLSDGEDAAGQNESIGIPYKFWSFASTESSD